MPDDAALYALSADLGKQLLAAGLRVAAAESCTGGWLAKVITDVPGSSQWFEGGVVTYTNQAKRELLGVTQATLQQQGAVSEATVGEMAAGVLAHTQADVAVAISGIAGPDGATPGKPVGMVCFAWGRAGAGIHCRTEYLSGDREAVRRQAVHIALQGLLDELTTQFA
jgi:nicotinamide-nucleotide amidase